MTLRNQSSKCQRGSWNDTWSKLSVTVKTACEMLLRPHPKDIRCAFSPILCIKPDAQGRTEFKLHRPDLTTCYFSTVQTAQLACIYDRCLMKVKNLHQWNSTHHTHPPYTHKPKTEQNKHKTSMLMHWNWTKETLGYDAHYTLIPYKWNHSTTRSFSFRSESII